MKIYELEKKIFAALVGNAELMAVLPSGANSIYHYVAPTADPSRYPIIVYAPISDVPALSGDNREIAHRVTIRIHVIAALKRFDADKRRFNAACDLVPAIMTEIGFVRRQTTPFSEDGKLMMIFDFIQGVES